MMALEGFPSQQGDALSFLLWMTVYLHLTDYAGIKQQFYTLLV